MKIADKMRQIFEDPLKSFKALQIGIAFVCIMIPAILRFCDKDEFYPEQVKLAGLENVLKCDSTIRIDTATKIKRNKTDSIFSIQICKSTTKILTVTKIPKDKCGFRLSISDYTYSSNSYLFGMLYCMAAMLFIYNWAVYVKNNLRRNKDDTVVVLKLKGQWYNLIIGLFLIGVILNPEHNHPFFHNVFSVSFFIANILVMVFVPVMDENKSSVRLRIIIAVSAIVILGLLIWLGLITLLWAEWISLTVIAIHLMRVAKALKLK